MCMGNIVSKRVNLTLPDTVFADLEIWAKERGQAVATLVAIVVEFAIRQAKQDGELPSYRKKKTPPTFHATGMLDSDQILQALMEGKDINEQSLALKAQELGYEPDALIQVFKKTKENR